MECLNASYLRTLEWEHNHNFQWSLRVGRVQAEARRLAFSLHASSTSCPWSSKGVMSICTVNQKLWRHSPWRASTAPASLEQEPHSLPQDDQPSDNIQAVEGDASDSILPQKLKPDELKSLLLDSERSKLLKKLSEANQYNRFLKRQLQVSDAALVNIKDELAALEFELQALVGLAEEVANSGIQPGTRKIDGKYIHSHLLSGLAAVLEKVKGEIKDVNSVKVREITLFWVGMAESVQIMGSFDGWSHGEEMSPAYNGDYARFSATLKLRPGRYEIKFLVDGEWLLSPELPTVGEGLVENNLLIVE